MEKNVPFYMSRKFWMEVIAAGVFLTLALTETVVFTSKEVMLFVLGLAGIAVGGHAVTDVGSMLASALASRTASAAPEEVVEIDDSDDEEGEDDA
jgi:hypothetical protein